MTFESHTRSRLDAIERSLNDYIQAKNKIPRDLEELIPDYLASIPDVVLGIREHKDSGRVVNYSYKVISNELVNGAMIEDSGGWGYVYSNRQVVVFVDCTHKSMNGTLWYRVRGIY